MPVKQNNAPIFLVGCPRSGTTLLASHLGRHPDLHALPETQFFAGSYAGAFWQRWWAARSPERFFDFIWPRNVRLADTGLDANLLRSDFVEQRVTNAQHAMKLLFERCLQGTGKTRIVEKSPRHIEYIEHIVRWFPDARIICIVRDGRDNVMSLANAHWTHNNTTIHASYWKFCAQIAQTKQKRHPNSVKLVKFEDFVSNTEQVLQEICLFADCTFSSAMLDTNIAVDTAPNWEADWKTRSTKPADSSLLDKWRTDLDQDKILALEADMKTELAALDYPMSEKNNPNFKTKPGRALFLKLRFMVRKIIQTHLVHKSARFRKRQLAKELNNKDGSHP